MNDFRKVITPGKNGRTPVGGNFQKLPLGVNGHQGAHWTLMNSCRRGRRVLVVTKLVTGDQPPPMHAAFSL
jgi:hypothetical protein